MSFWSKITDNKGVALAFAAVSLGGAVLWAYNQYSKQEEGVVVEVRAQQIIEEIKVIDIHAELTKLKLEIDLNNPSFEDVKKILKLLAEYVRSKTMNLSNKFKAERRKRFPKEERTSRISEYLKFSCQGLMELQNMVMKLQQEQTQLMASIGLSQAKLSKYAHLLGQFMQELMFGQDIKFQDVKRNLVMKIEYLEIYGQKIVDSLIQLSASLDMHEKQFIPMFLNIIISDDVFQNEPDLDKEQYEIAIQQYKNQLVGEMNRLQTVLMPLMGKLQTTMIGDGMGAYGGYGGEEQYGDMGGMGGGMGGMGGGFGNLDPQQQAMIEQQLEMMRQQDPQGYEQLMAMMQASMPR